MRNDLKPETSVLMQMPVSLGRALRDVKLRALNLHSFDDITRTTRHADDKLILTVFLCVISGSSQFGSLRVSKCES